LRAYRYFHLDVFTDRPLTGNQLAVFPDAGGLDADTMQRVALEMAFSETTFVFASETAGIDACVRIFTPHVELPMAGHPTIGTAFALAAAARVPPGQPSITLGLGVGPTAVRLQWDSERLDFAWMRQAIPALGVIVDDVASAASALNVDAGEIAATALPVQVVSAGVPFLLIPLASRSAVDDVALDRARFGDVCRAAGIPELPVFVFSLEPAGDVATAYSRMFAPVLGIDEDPATGGACGPLGGYLLHHGAVTSARARSMLNLQGVKMRRPSRIHISIDTVDGAITEVLVGGRAVVVGEGVARFETLSRT
jgi:trans-2,3-dihydro-3-hydroxyanthranilate isomerase